MAKGKMIEAFIKSTYDGKGVKEAKKDLNDLKSSGKDTNNTMSKLFDAGKIGLFAKGLSTATSKIGQLAKKSSDYIETLNVLDVAFDSNTDSIRKFTSSISETLNLDEASIIKMAGAFKTLANSLGYSNEVGGEFAELMTKVTLDASSLYNLSLDKSRSMLQSAIMGRGQSLAKTGANVLESTVQGILDKLNIDAEIESMNGAEKAMARTIAIIYQLQNAQGDLARTIETPANQFRVLGEQISQVGRNIGNVFLPMIDAILPYLNAVLIVVNKLIASFAAFIGFREDKWDVYNGKTSNLADAFDNLGASVGGVGSAAKETKKQLMGLRSFDKLNVIKTPRPSSGSGGAGGGGINKNLLDAFNKLAANYDLGLAGIETRATKIAKAIMKALGDIDFTNLINSGKRLWEAFKPFAQNVGQGLLWAFDNILKPLAKWTITDLLPTFLDTLADTFIILNNTIETFKPLGEWLWKNFLSPLGKWAGGTIVKTLKDFESVLRKISKNKLLSTILTGGVVFTAVASNIGKITTALGKTKLGGAISNLIKPMRALYDNTKLYVSLAKKSGGSLIDGIKAGNDAWRKQYGIINDVTGKVDGLKGVMNGAKIAVQNLGIAAVGLEGLKVALEDAATQGLNLGNSLGAVSGAFATISGSISAGAVFGPMGAAIGGVVGSIGVLTVGLDTLFDKLNEKNKTATDLINEQRDAIQQQNDKALENIELVYTQTDRAKELSAELGNYVDENGRVTGSVDKVNSILDELNGLLGTEYTVTGDTITQNGNKIKSLQGIQTEIDKYINKLKAQVIQEQIQALYKDALDKQIRAMQQRNEKADIINELTKKAIDNNGQLSLKERDRLEKAKKDYANLSTSIDGYQKNMDNYSKAGQEALKGNYDTAVDYLSKSEKGVYKSFDELMKGGDKNVSQSITNMQKNLKKLGDTKIKIKGTVEVDDSAVKKLKSQFQRQKVTFKANNGKAIIGNLDISQRAKGGILINGKWKDVAKYDTGGLPPVGQMFIARERGPELVGNIGGHTAVMNNNQIVSSVSSGVAQAVRGVMNGYNSGNGVYNIYLDKDHKLGTYTLEQLQGMAKSNGRPITIG